MSPLDESLPFVDILLASYLAKAHRSLFEISFQEEAFGLWKRVFIYRMFWDLFLKTHVCLRDCCSTFLIHSFYIFQHATCLEGLV